MVDGGDQVAQLVHGIVDRVGNGAGKVFSHRYGHRQVAICQLFDFVEQAHDGLLVAFVLFCGLAQLAVGGAHHDQADEDDRGQRQQPQGIAANGVEGAPASQVLETVRQVRRFVEQGLRKAEDVARSLPHTEQFGRGFEDFIH
ncbi:hypothetical protein D9M73_248300 [compost metagenome]